jgi:regulatory protein
MPEQACLEAAFRYLSYRARSEAELRTYLKRRNFDPATIENVLFKLRQDGLIDDSAFARWWKENRESFRPRSRARLWQELKEKGVSPTIITEVLQDVDEEANAFKLAQKKTKELVGVDYNTFRQKLGSFLSGQGFSLAISHQIINQLWETKDASIASK